MSAERHTLFQTSLMAALLDGIYEGDMTVGELLEHGDFGIGTFNALDGEMVVVDGVAYRLRGDGTAAAASADSATPYAVVTDFVPTLTRTLPDGVTRAPRPRPRSMRSPRRPTTCTPCASRGASAG
jgi:acetolactate decarboxylase